MSWTSSNKTSFERTDFPYIVEKQTQITIPLHNDCKLAATIWMPKKTNDVSQIDEKFAAILEYLPYRKADLTSIRDEIRLKYFAGFGYVSVRVDIRGTGNSEGIFDDEYSYQEQSDGLEILQWIEKQKWSNGKVVIFGKSWGGFNGLQIGALQPKNLVGIISTYSTDDRYSDDIHYCGGCLSAQEALAWSSQMLIWLSLPPHPEYHGGLEDKVNISSIWKERLDNLLPLDAYWMKHQTRNNYWRYGSVCEDYPKIQCPVLLIGGFADLYSDPVFRLMNKLQCPKRAILGPWGHQWPDQAYPGPQIGFLQMIIRWLDYYTKGIDNGMENEDIMSVYELYPNSNELHSIVEERKGQWISLNYIPSYPSERDQRNNNLPTKQDEIIEEKFIYYLSPTSLQTDKASNILSPKTISFCSQQETGTASGNWLGWGSLHKPDHPTDQGEDDGRSVCFDSPPLTNDCELFGFPSVHLKLSSNCPNGLICVRLCMIEEDTSASILISRGVFNLTHFKSHEHPEELKINEIYNIDVTLSGICVRLPAGSRLRLALSSSYWPLVWPSSNLTTLTIHFDQSSPCVLTLPSLTEKYSLKADFGSAEISSGLQMKELRKCSSSRFRTFDDVNELITLHINHDDGSCQYPDGLIYDEKLESTYQIKKHDPQSARIEIQRNLKYYFLDDSLIQTDIDTKSIMCTDRSSSTFIVQHQLEIKNKNEIFFHKIWNLQFPRIYN